MTMVENINLALKNYPYAIAFIMILVGFYLLLADKNLIKKVMGLNLVQGGVIVFYILISKIDNALPAIYNIKASSPEVYANPLPSVLMLTAIVVGISTTSLACALIYRIYKNYHTLDESEIARIKQEETRD
ncbi:Na(+)/H(+) antiporter subunit C [Candidatus Hepatincolaceae symbiont of Richtersius coronifer]